MKDLIEKIEGLKVKAATDDFGYIEKYFYNRGIDKVLVILNAYQEETYNYFKNAGLVHTDELSNTKTPEACGAEVVPFNMAGARHCLLPKWHSGRHRIYYEQQQVLEWD